MNRFIPVSAKRLFWIVIGILAVIMMLNATQVGTGGDEVMDGMNGKYSLEYYLNGDTTFVHYSQDPVVVHDYIKYYGVGFEIIPAVIIKIFQADRYEFIIRHLLNALFGLILICFSGLCGKELKNWNLGILTVVIIALIPSIFGLCYNDSKDVPMAAGFMIATWAFIRIYKNLPVFRLTDVIGAIAGIALAVSIRIGGLMLPFYFAVGILLTFIFKKELRMLLLQRNYGQLARIFFISVGIVLAGMLIGFCAYPNFFYEGPVDHILNAVKEMKKFVQPIPLLFEGQIILSTRLPNHYLPKLYLITFPLFVLAGAVFFIGLSKRIFRTYNKTNLLLLLFMFVFPPVYIAWSDASLYNSWRHTMFVYPPFALIAAVGIYELYHFFNKQYLRCLLVAGIALSMGATAFWMVKNFRYSYAYHNVFVPSPYLKYDIEYYETSCTRGYDWLRENILTKSDRQFVIASKIFTPKQYGAALGDTNVEVHQVPFMAFAETDCDYFILTPQIIAPKVLKSFFPPRGTLHVEYVDDIPICAVVEKKNKYDCFGIRAIRTGKIDEGMALLEKAYAYDPRNFGIWFWMGYGYFYQRKYEDAIRFFSKYVNFNGNGSMLTMSFVMSGEAFMNLRKYNEAIQCFEQGLQLDVSKNYTLPVLSNIGLCYRAQKKYAQAIPYLEKVYRQNSSIIPALYDCYVKTGNMQKAAALRALSETESKS